MAGGNGGDGGYGPTRVAGAGGAGGAGGASLGDAGSAGASGSGQGLHGGGGGGAAGAAGGSGGASVLGGSAGTGTSPAGGAGHQGNSGSGGGGGGGGYSATGYALPTSDTTGGVGGAGGYALVNAGGGGGGGGYGAIVVGAALGVSTTTIAGGVGGAGGNTGGPYNARFSSYGGSGGSGGVGAQFTASDVTVTNAGTMRGGHGGAGGNLQAFSRYGGTGGAGGAGAQFTTNGANLTNDGTIQGGTGGAAGDNGYRSLTNPGAPPIILAGAAGGAGVMASGATIVNTNTIAGGSGGTGSLGNTYGQLYGTGGMGGAGIVGGNLAITNSGKIVGGSGGAGVTGASGNTGPTGAAGDAIDVTGGTSSLALGATTTTNGTTTTTMGTLTGQLGVTGSLTLTTPATTKLTNVIHDGAGGAGALVYDSPSVLTLAGLSTYSGGTTIAAGTLELGVGDVSSSTTITAGAVGTGAVTFAAAPGQTATLALQGVAQPGNGGTFGTALDDFGANDTLELEGFRGLAATYAPSALGATTGTLTVTAASGKTEMFTLADPGSQLFVVTQDAQGNSLVRAAAVCFAAGTAIRTARGDIAVEALRVGDLAVTASGALRPIRWLGHRAMRPAEHPVSADIWPVRIAAHAFGPGLPARDLMLSPGHSVLVGADADREGGHLVPIMCLINGTTIARAKVDAVTYWHIELDAHDVLLAEGLPAESYIDLGSRPWFAGADGALYDPDMALPGMPGRCRPVAIDGPVVEAERGRLDAVFAIRLASACAWPSDGTIASPL